MKDKIEVGVLGATGMVGQQFINQLKGHPWFELAWLGASERSAGKAYREAANWTLDGDIPVSIADQIVHESTPGDAPKLIFSAMDASVAGPIEQSFANAGCFVVSNSRNHRMEFDVPLLIPEVNADHLGLIQTQRRNRGWNGAIITNPNCSTITMAMGLAPLKPFGIKTVLATTMQAISGAGYPGMPSMDILSNVVPYIGGEEAKMESETQKILGDFHDGKIAHLDATVSTHCNRVGVVDGHTIAVSVSLDQSPTINELKDVIASFRGLPQEKNLPSAPAQPVHVMTMDDRPQPRKDVLLEDGMAVSVGRIRECNVLGYKFVVLSHNTIRGAAGAAVLNAELLKSQGLLD
tara:strand:- start:5048 stop:6097 length:1050 start_codon:yes stop_codon:yes gene_type:complete